MLDVYTTDWAIKWLDRDVKHPENTTQKMVDFLHDFRAATLKEAADRAVAFIEEYHHRGDCEYASDLRAAIEGVQK